MVVKLRINVQKRIKNQPSCAELRAFSCERTRILIMSSLPLCVARCNGEKFWWSIPLGFAFPFVSNVYRIKETKFRQLRCYNFELKNNGENVFD